MVKEVIEIDVRTKEGKAKLKELQTGVKDVGTTSKEASKDINALGGAADKATGGAISGFNALKGTVGSAIKQFGVLRLAVAATGIGALILAITAVGKAFTSSEEGQNKFAKIMGVIGAITGNLVDLLADLGEKLISVFENPKQALKDFGNLIRDNIQTRFEGLTELIPQLGKAINLLFKGEFSEAGKVAGNAVAKVALGVDDLSGKIQGAIDKTKEFIAENVNEAKIAAQIADQRAKADKQERALLTERAEANRKIAELREKAADKENVSVQERIEALQEAGRINEEITLKEIEAARLRFEAKKAENALSKSTKEDLDEEAQLQARLIDLETARLLKQKALTAEITTATREAASEQKAIKDKEAADDKARDDAEAKRKADIKAIEDETRKKDEEAAAETELQKIELEKQRTLEKLDFLKATEEERANIIASFDAKIKAQKDKDREAERIAEEILQKQKIAIVGQTFGAIAGILGQNSKAGKAAAIAQATINTYQGITEVLSNKTTLPEPFGTIQKIASAGTVLASGLKAVRSITSQQLPNISGARGGGGSIGSASAPSLALPSFNVVGQSATNQLAQTIAGQQQKPIKAYVVSNDVTSAQSMERNIIEGASI